MPRLPEHGRGALAPQALQRAPGLGHVQLGLRRQERRRGQERRPRLDVGTHRLRTRRDAGEMQREMHRSPATPPNGRLQPYPTGATPSLHDTPRQAEGVAAAKSFIQPVGELRQACSLVITPPPPTIQPVGALRGCSVVITPPRRHHPTCGRAAAGGARRAGGAAAHRLRRAVGGGAGLARARVRVRVKG